MTKLFLNLDLETTGLDPDKDHILEIAWDILDEELVSVMVEPRTFIVDHGEDWGDVFSALRSAPAVVREMHEKSGLAGALLTQRGAQNIAGIARVLESDLRVAKSSHSIRATTHLMGFSPEFDRSFLKEYPSFGALLSESAYIGLHHRLYNLSSFKIGYELAGVEIPKIKNPNPHRALSDIGEVAEFGRLVLRDLKGETL